MSEGATFLTSLGYVCNGVLHNPVLRTTDGFGRGLDLRQDERNTIGGGIAVHYILSSRFIHLGLTHIKAVV